MKLRSPFAIRLIAIVFAFIVRCWLATLRFRNVSVDGRPHPENPNVEPLIYAFWHEALLIPLRQRVRLDMLIGQHADGELIAQVARRFGFGVIRGSSTRGGGRAIRGMINLQDVPTHLGITPDGPKGPRRQVQMGMIAVASATGRRILPVGIGFARAWRAKSWDRFAVPYPFSTVCWVWGRAMTIPPELDRHELESWRQKVETHLVEVSELADAWGEIVARDGRNAPPPAAAMPQASRQAA
jgi:lysophospholipid acyltransferase (LPLAT)-like uncharacterized protein